MGTTLKEKMHHDTNEYLGNLLNHYGEYTMDMADKLSTSTYTDVTLAVLYLVIHHLANSTSTLLFLIQKLR